MVDRKTHTAALVTLARHLLAASGDVTAAEAARVAHFVVEAIPPRSAPAAYAAFVVDRAIARYETQGREATLARYRRRERVDGEWYVCIIDEDGRVAAHPDPDRVGLHVTGWAGADPAAGPLAPELLPATGEGTWVTLVLAGPEGGDPGPGAAGAAALENVWVVRHDGLLFASGR